MDALMSQGPTRDSKRSRIEIANRGTRHTWFEWFLARARDWFTIAPLQSFRFDASNRCGNDVMAFGSRMMEDAKARERQSQWICEPGAHRVKITKWEYQPPGTRKSVRFTVQDSSGRKLYVSFRLTVGELRCGRLLGFVIAARRWNPLAYQGLELSINSRSTYRDLLGRQVRVYVDRNNNGLHEVINWSEDPESCDDGDSPPAD